MKVIECASNMRCWPVKVQVLTHRRSELFDKLLGNLVGTKLEDKFGTTLRQLLRKYVTALTQL